MHLVSVLLVPSHHFLQHLDRAAHVCNRLRSRSLQRLLRESSRRRTGHKCVLQVQPYPMPSRRSRPFLTSRCVPSARLLNTVNKCLANLASSRACPLHPLCVVSSSSCEMHSRSSDACKKLHLLAGREHHVPTHVPACLELGLLPVDADQLDTYGLASRRSVPSASQCELRVRPHVVSLRSPLQRWTSFTGA